MADTRAAFEATYSDWKVVRGRKVCQIVLEVPIERANEALNALGGMPNPAEEIWVGVARLETESPPVAPAERKRSQGEIAGILSSTPSFRVFVNENFCTCQNEEEAAAFIRTHCLVKSRSELNDANQYWRNLLSDYDAWKLCLV